MTKILDIDKSLWQYIRLAFLLFLSLRIKSIVATKNIENIEDYRALSQHELIINSSTLITLRELMIAWLMLGRFLVKMVQKSLF